MTLRTYICTLVGTTAIILSSCEQPDTLNSGDEVEADSSFIRIVNPYLEAIANFWREGQTQRELDSLIANAVCRQEYFQSIVKSGGYDIGPPTPMGLDVDSDGPVKRSGGIKLYELRMPFVADLPIFGPWISYDRF